MAFTYTECIVEGYLKACEEYGWLAPAVERLYEIAIEKNGRNQFEDFVPMDADGSDVPNLLAGLENNTKGKQTKASETVKEAEESSLEPAADDDIPFENKEETPMELIIFILG